METLFKAVLQLFLVTINDLREGETVSKVSFKPCIRLLKDHGIYFSLWLVESLVNFLVHELSHLHIICLNILGSRHLLVSIRWTQG
jgi:hypothetical protein